MPVATVTSIQSAKPTSSCKGNKAAARNDIPQNHQDELRAGFLLLDSSLNLISFNPEALQILGYSRRLDASDPLAESLDAFVRAKLFSGHPPRQSAFVTEFRSGRRRYFCRMFPLNSHAVGTSFSSIAQTAILLERGPSGFVCMPKAAQKFNLTRREREVLELLVQGLEIKGIASRMRISPNTVKVFLRLIMTKMGVSSRSAILVKLVMS